MSRRFGLSALGLGLGFLAVGCGPGESPPPPITQTYSIKGKVGFPDGAPLRGGLVVFTPVQADAGGGKFRATGQVNVRKGTYAFTGGTGSAIGVSEGEYTVTVTPEPFEIPPAEYNGKNIPAKYQKADTTPLKFVCEGKDGEFDIVLK